MKFVQKLKKIYQIITSDEESETMTEKKKILTLNLTEVTEEDLSKIIKFSYESLGIFEFKDLAEKDTLDINQITEGIVSCYSKNKKYKNEVMKANQEFKVDDDFIEATENHPAYSKYTIYSNDSYYLFVLVETDEDGQLIGNPMIILKLMVLGLAESKTFDNVELSPYLKFTEYDESNKDSIEEIKSKFDKDNQIYVDAVLTGGKPPEEEKPKAVKPPVPRFKRNPLLAHPNKPKEPATPEILAQMERDMHHEGDGAVRQVLPKESKEAVKEVMQDNFKKLKEEKPKESFKMTISRPNRNINNNYEDESISGVTNNNQYHINENNMNVTVSKPDIDVVDFFNEENHADDPLDPEFDNKFYDLIAQGYTETEAYGILLKAANDHNIITNRMIESKVKDQETGYSILESDLIDPCFDKNEQMKERNINYFVRKGKSVTSGEGICDIKKQQIIRSMNLRNRRRH